MLFRSGSARGRRFRRLSAGFYGFWKIFAGELFEILKSLIQGGAFVDSLLQERADRMDHVQGLVDFRIRTGCVRPDVHHVLDTLKGGHHADQVTTGGDDRRGGDVGRQTADAF